MSTQYKEFIVKAGEYSGKINKAEWVQSQYRTSKDNPNGDSLNLWIDLDLDGSKYKRVFDTISVTDLLKINQARVSAGLKEFRETKTLLKKDVSDMEDQTVLIKVDVYTSKAGKRSNIIRDYLEQGDSYDNQEENSGSIPF